MAEVTMRGIRKSYDNHLEVIKGVDLEVKDGEFMVFVGPSGCGKSTMMRMVAGLESITGGELRIGDKVANDLPAPLRGVAMVFQSYALYPTMTVADNIRAILELSIDDLEKRHEMLDELLGEFSITHLRRTPAITLSGGERRRVEIARCLAAQPKYVLLDEPFAGVDPLAVSDIRALVSHLKDRGIGVLITDHNVRETLDIVDRAYILHAGAVLMSGTPDEVVRDDNVRRVYLGDSFRI